MFKLNNKKIIVILVMLIFCFSFQTEAKELTLSEALKIGLKENLEISQIENDLDKSEIDLELAWRALMPEIKAETTYNLRGKAPQVPTADHTMIYNPEDLKTESPPFADEVPLEVKLIPQMEEGSRESYNTSISFNQPLYMGGQIRLGIEQARKGKKMAQLQAKQKKNEIIFNIIQTYYNVLMAQERVDIEKAALDLVSEHRKIAKSSYDSGAALKTDFLQAKIEERKQQQSLEEAKNKLYLAQKNMKNLLNINTGEIVLKEPGLKPDLDLNINKLYQIAKNRRPELLMSKLQKKLTENSLKLEKRSNYPQLFLRGNYSWQGEELSFEEGNWNIMVSGSITLFDGGKSNLKEEKLENDLKNQDLSLGDLKKMIKLDIENEIMNLNELQNQISIQQENIELARESLSLEEKRFKAGVGKSVDVLQAQMTLKQTKLSLVQSKYNYQKSLFSLLKKTGQLVEYCQGVVTDE